MQEPRVLLVDAEDRPIGTAGKQEAHVLGLRHRALSVVLINAQGEMLVQRRAEEKYHSGGLWANACCSHPRPDEVPDAAAARRLHEELGVTSRLRGLGTVSYRAEVGNGLIEDEVVHLFVGRHHGVVRPAPEEVSACAWMAADLLFDDVARQADRYAPWFRIYLQRFGHGLFEP